MDEDLEGMTLEALQAEFVRLAQQLVPLQNRRQAIADLMEKRTRQAGARARVLAMVPADRDALRAALDAEEGKAS